MKVPNAHIAIIEEEKIRGYLLNPQHRYGATKAQFLTGFGFSLEDWQALAAALREHAEEHEVARTRETGFGPRYEVEGELRAPNGAWPRVRAVWQMDEGQIAPRLLTAYPLERL